MPSNKNSAGQPQDRALGWHRLGDSRMDELIGLCRGVLADGTLVEAEVRFLYDWFCRNEPVRCTPFGRKLFDQLETSVKKQCLTPQDEEALVITIFKLIGGTPASTADASHSSTLPLDDPPPTVMIQDRTFCFTGKFSFGSRAECQEMILKLNGRIDISPTQHTSYLIIGDIGSRDWVHSTHGRKIEKALEFKHKGFPLAIIHEQHWICFLPPDAKLRVPTDGHQDLPKQSRQRRENPSVSFVISSQQEPVVIAGPFAGKNVILLGTLKSFDYGGLAKRLESLGATVMSNMTRKTNLVIAGLNAGNRLDKARQLNIEVWDEANLLSRLAKQ